ncbi:helix-turn-helix domain-containing protein [Aquibacillus sp. 3ASR75-11]|uniref:Helix-turn-helix domain-containing protein n=1 Tax=Terrihalobacillus insolitus TaxID=2950438 RepID=A0A9X3WWA9_9BACI|nr:helix-turn-helix domain-containing protein [Terrihalobacillus insolitus]MDC3414185.1 helix-turn-helix domain-containing protein [Terrihalobacillus insolitus]MDC3425391.1 helix-turn-helix domain-containing protein [Terrihalobacillus insolitus]
MEVGSFIKIHRIKQNMTQEDLADGIVSESYLSKIENQKTVASPEVIDMLCVRLGVQYRDQEDSILEEKCKDWFDLLFENNSRDTINAKYEELEELMKGSNSDYEMLFEIHKIRYYLVLGEERLALKQINSLRELASNFENSAQYYWFKFNGNYNSVMEEYNQAMRFYRLAEEKIVHADISENEEADLKYTMAVTYSKIRNTLEAIDYSNKAIDIFRKNYNFHRCAQCHIILGISYRRIRVYDKAIKNYNLARHLAELDKDETLIRLTNINLGHLHASKGDTKQAIHFFNSVLEKAEVDAEDKLVAISSLIGEYYNSHNYDKAKEMVDEGLKTIENVSSDAKFKTLYYYKLSTYYYSLNKDVDRFEAIVVNEFIPYLQKQKDYANLVIYANMVGKHFEDRKKYKSANKFYKLVNLSYEQIIKI